MSEEEVVPQDTGLLSPVRAGAPVEEAVGDRAWLRAMLSAEAALARAQAGLGSMPTGAADVITRTARECEIDVRAVALASRESANPVVALIREFAQAVGEHDPAAAEYVHRGATSQDIFDTAAMLVSERALALIHQDLEAIGEALGRIAHRHREVPMVGRTLALHAVPVTFGLKASGWRDLVLDARDRVGTLLEGGLPVSLGGAAGTLAGYMNFADVDGQESGYVPDVYPELLVAAFAKETGLARQRVPWHALRTPVADLAAVLGFTAGALGKIALDVLTLARTEIAEVGEPGSPGRGASSAMPHKRNPVLATMVRAVSLQVPVLAAGLTQCLTTEDERSGGVWHAEWALLREALRLTGGASHTARELAEGLRVHPERMARNLELSGGKLSSERLAVVLSPRLGRVQARELLGWCAEQVDGDRSLAQVLFEALEGEAATAGMFTQGQLATLCDPTRGTGASLGLVEKALRRA